MSSSSRWLSVFLAAVFLLALCVPVGASDLPPMPQNGGFGPPPEGGPGGPGGAGSAGQEFATFDEVSSHAGIYIGSRLDAPVNEDLRAPEGTDFAGRITVADGVSAPLSASGLSGVKLEGGTGDNGVVIDLGSEAQAMFLGAPEDHFTVDGEGYNTVIQVDAGQGNNDAGYEAVHGVGVAVNSGTLYIENSYVRSEGPRSTPVYMFSTQSPGATSLIVRDSHLEAYSDEIWMPPFKLLAGGARATLLMTRNNSWFYNSEVISNNWGAISQDSVDAMTYVVNSTGMSTEGGYGTYLTYGMRLYGSALYGGQYGAFMCGESDLMTDRGSAALEDPEAMSKTAEGYEPDDRESVIAAPCNAIVIHNSLPNLDMVAHGQFRNTLVSTQPKDLPEAVTPMAADDPFFMPGVDIIGSGAGCGASYFFTRNLYGSLALVRSMNADLTFDGAETRTSNGVLVQSVVTYDPPSASGYLTPEQGSTVPGISASFRHGEYAGDILHQDYQRPMYVTVGEGSTLTGKVVSGTWAAWNDLWSEEHLTAALEADGHDPAEFQNEAWVEDVQANLTRPEDMAYAGTENLGIAMTLEPGSIWTVTEDSSLKQLTLSEDAQILPAEGCALSFHTGCNNSNDGLFYDDSEAEELEALPAGTYENVVIRVTELPQEEPEAAITTETTEIAEPASPEPVVEFAEPEVQEADDQSQEQPEADVPEQHSASPVVPIVAAVVIVGAGAAAIFRKKRE